MKLTEREKRIMDLMMGAGRPVTLDEVHEECQKGGRWHPEIIRQCHHQEPLLQAGHEPEGGLPDPKDNENWPWREGRI
jgi:hypothetical protein